MPSIVDVCNRALSRLGSLRVTVVFPTPDNSKAARACHSAWGIVRDEVLRAHPWNCAITRAELAADTATPEWGFDSQFTLPSDCLRVLEVDTAGHWQIESRKLLTDEDAPLYVRYIRREEDVSLWDPLLVSAMASRLAAELSREIADVSGNQQQLLLVEYRAILDEAKRSDAQESSVPDLSDLEWIAVR